MGFSKSVIILKQLEKGYSLSGKTISAIARLESENEITDLYLTLVNANHEKSGEFVLFLLKDTGEQSYFELSGKNSFNARLYGIKDSLGFSAGLFYVENSLPVLVAYGESDTSKVSVNKLKKTFSENIINKLKEEKKNSKDYDDEVVATENYYLNDEELKEKLRLIKEVDDEDDGLSFSTFSGKNQKETTEKQTETYGDKNGADYISSEKFTESNPYFKSVRKELEDIFNKFKKEETLEKCIPDSKWVKIYFSETKYYVVGLVKEEGAVKYICYGVPSAFSETPPKSLQGFCCFVPRSVIKLKGDGYWMMFQDAISGECVSPE